MHRSAGQGSAVQCSAGQYSAVQCSFVKCTAERSGIVQLSPVICTTKQEGGQVSTQNQTFSGVPRGGGQHLRKIISGAFQSKNTNGTAVNLDCVH